MLSAPSLPENWEIPGYTIHEKIGEGGMVQVYRATQLSLRRVVAIKWLNPSLDNQAPHPAFHRESQLMASLIHPHVVAIHDSGQVNGRHYLVMEYVRGVSLRTAMEPERAWTMSQASTVLRAIAEALIFIHDQGILHLDLKPENVLCGDNGAIKVTDFG